MPLPSKSSKAQLEPVSFSVSEASEYVGISKSSMWRLLASGAVPRIRLGGRTVVALDDLNQLISAARRLAKAGGKL